MTKKYGALAGVAAAAVALGLGEAIAVVVSARSGPLVAVGGLVIDRVPESGKELAISLFGTYDKVALQVGTVVVLGGIAALLGVLATRRLWFGLAGIGVFAVIGAVAALTRTGSNATWVLPSVLGAIGAGVTLWLLLRLVAPPEEAPAMDQPAVDQPPVDQPAMDQPAVDQPPVAQPPVGALWSTEDARRMLTATERRRFLQIAAATIGGAAVVGVAGRMFAGRSQVDGARSAVALPTPTGPRAVAPPAADAAGLVYTTPNSTFYRIDTAIFTPRVDPAGWTLRIHGRVARELTLTFDDLLRRPMIERYVTLACVSNEVGGDLIGNAKWLGVPVKDLLEEAGPADGADQVVSRSVDGFTAGTPTKALLDGRDAMIAIGMNGEPLPIDHGFPARMVVPGLYGYVSATKWLSELEVTTFADFDAYWIPRGWAQMAPIKTSSRIDKPRDGQTVAAGPVVIAGVAWAQQRGISKVEVSVDEGPWQTATLAATLSIDTWRLWSLSWDATPGTHRLRVRATDNAGEVQTPAVAPPAPDGATGLHAIEVNVA